MKKLIYTFAILAFASFVSSVSAQWVQFSSGMGNKDVQSLAYSGTKIFAGTYSNGVYLSTNNGANWTQTSLNNRDIRALAIIGDNVIAGTMNNGIYFSTNNGASWTQSNLITEDVWTLAVGGNNVFAGTDHTGVYISTNNGSSWSQTSMTNITVNSLFISGNDILAAAGVGGWGVFLSVNNGNSWTLIGDLNIGTYSVAASGNYIYAGPYYHGIYLSTDFGIHWNQTPLDNGTVVAIAVSGNNVFAGTEGYGFEISNDNGTSWTHRSEGLGSAYIMSLCIINNYIYAGTGNGVYKRPLSEIIGINQISNEVPKHLSLSQNYPNPFNPKTNIKFDIPKNAFVTMKVFDILGREVATLVNEKLAPGTYEVDWNGSGYTSGVYFYRLEAGDFVETKKMVLIK
ncbi:MAG: T9SS type A sorting domain-containing protein [Ignavibacteria bacterium]|nr:T9SS type A sorting domain-containing protein [Ignavibacteria bacterium]